MERNEKMDNATLEQKHGEARAAWHLATKSLDAVDGEIQRNADAGLNTIGAVHKLNQRRDRIRDRRNRAYTELTRLTQKMDARDSGGSWEPLENTDPRCRY